MEQQQCDGAQVLRERLVIEASQRSLVALVLSSSKREVLQRRSSALENAKVKKSAALLQKQRKPCAVATKRVLGVFFLARSGVETRCNRSAMLRAMARMRTGARMIKDLNAVLGQVSKKSQTVASSASQAVPEF